jgi:hypothetical protein
MFTLENQSGDDFASRGNDQESDTEGSYTHQKYDPEDFSQSAINEGQRIINYQLTEVAKKLSNALSLLMEVLAKTAGLNQDDVVKIKREIAEASEISKIVADIFPPGCDPPPPPPPKISA